MSNFLRKLFDLIPSLLLVILSVINIVGFLDENPYQLSVLDGTIAVLIAIEVYARKILKDSD